MRVIMIDRLFCVSVALIYDFVINISFNYYLNLKEKFVKSLKSL